MFINTFKYGPEDVSCKLCTEYVKKLGCTALHCPWLAERIEAGVPEFSKSQCNNTDLNNTYFSNAFLILFAKI